MSNQRGLPTGRLITTMSNSCSMRVAVVGSWKSRDKEKWNLKANKDEFAIACNSLGKKIARYQRSVIIGSIKEDTADFHVMMGMLEELRGKIPTRPLIWIQRPNKDPDAFQDLDEDYPGVFSFYAMKQPSWDSAHLTAIRDADIVIIIGGGKGTYEAGIGSMTDKKKKIVPIASFGGASENILRNLEEIAEKRDRDKLSRLRSAWNDHLLDYVLHLTGIRNFPRLCIIHGRSNDWKKLKEFLQNEMKTSEPKEMGEEYGKSDTLAEKWERITADLDGTIALVTPDDKGGLVNDEGRTIKEKEIKYTSRARENIWLEVGWFWGKLGRDRVLILRKGETNIPSDWMGVEYAKYDDGPSDARDDIRDFIESLKAF